MFLENKLPLQDILVTMNIPMCNIVNYISDDEMIAGCTVKAGTIHAIGAGILIC